MKKIISIMLCIMLITAISILAYAGNDRVCSSCVADSNGFSLPRSAYVDGSGVNVRYHHEVTSNADVLASAYNEYGVVTRVYYSDYSWFYFDNFYGNAIGHNGWIRGDYVNLSELR